MEGNTTMNITVTVCHDTSRSKQQIVEMWCAGLKEGQKTSGFNGLGERASLVVDEVKEEFESKNSNNVSNFK